MKYLLSSVAIVAALAIAAPVSAQRTGPGAAAPTGTGPGVTPPGGVGPSSPLYNLPGQNPPGYAPPAGSQGQPGQPPGGQMAPGAQATSAAPPMHRHVRHHGHVAAHHTTKGIPVSGNPNMSANQMNADELARLQAGQLGNPPPSALPYSEPSAASADTGRGPGRQQRLENAPGR
jgi:hypothetical protein